MSDTGTPALPHREEVVEGKLSNRIHFLWNQQRYLLENIKLSDTKAGFVMTFAAAVLGAEFSPVRRPSFSLTQETSTTLSVFALLVAVVGILLLVAAVLASALSIKPRLRGEARPSPVSWVNVAQYPDFASFRSASWALDDATAADHLMEPVFHLSHICVTKHRLVSRAIACALSGGALLAIHVVIH